MLRLLIKRRCALKNSQSISPLFDPWEPYLDIKEYGQLTLTNIEFTTTLLCNMRCEHCAVGYTLRPKDPTPLPIELVLKRLEEIPTLRTLSITGGEPMLSLSSIHNYLVPILKYAHQRGIRTQLNSNLTLNLDRYERIVPYLDVLHISHNWGTLEDFIDAGFARMENKPTVAKRIKYFERMIENSRSLAKAGVMVSAETMLNKRTLPFLEKIHRQIVNEMHCQRHEIHPMYPSNFASNLETLSLKEMRTAIHQLLDIRDQNIWMLFGTLPFYPCSSEGDDVALLNRLDLSKNVTVRNDPDGRSRLNVNIFNGDISVTDFGDTSPLGNIVNARLNEAFQNWRGTSLAKSISCHCPRVQCLGPNILVKDRYYKEVDYMKLEAKMALGKAKK
jgi:radical SAM/CxCxxxxC motif protein YfkAB